VSTIEFALPEEPQSNRHKFGFSVVPNQSILHILNQTDLVIVSEIDTKSRFEEDEYPEIQVEELPMIGPVQTEVASYKDLPKLKVIKNSIIDPANSKSPLSF